MPNDLSREDAKLREQALEQLKELRQRFEREIDDLAPEEVDRFNTILEDHSAQLEFMEEIIQKYKSGAMSEQETEMWLSEVHHQIHEWYQRFLKNGE